MSLMHRETLEIPEVISRQLQHNTIAVQKFCEALQHFNPAFIMTVARGSSDHAALFMKYLWETQLNLCVASAHPSIYTLYTAPMQVKNSLIVGLSQSGQSPDICEVMRYGRSSQALTLALVNEADSPMAQLAEHVLPLHGSPELSVAATKSYVAMLVAALQVTASFKQDDKLNHALHALPQILRGIDEKCFNPLYAAFNTATNALIIGRGFGLAIAEEIALKFKEVTQIHAESFSGAEILHGPFSLFHEALPVIIFMQNDPTLPSLQNLISRIRKTPVRPILIGDARSLQGNEDLPHIILPEVHSLLTPVLCVFVMYRFIETLAQSKGLDPDSPPLIQKVTRTM